MDRELAVGIVRQVFIRAAHSQGWRTAPQAFALSLAPELRLNTSHREVST